MIISFAQQISLNLIIENYHLFLSKFPNPDKVLFRLMNSEAFRLFGEVRGNFERRSSYIVIQLKFRFWISHFGRRLWLKICRTDSSPWRVCGD